MRAVSFIALLLTFGCGDPVNDDARSALGGEKPGVPKGPLHRPGQPCLACHGGSGPASAAFSFAGTVYQNQGCGRAAEAPCPTNTLPNDIPLADALVTLMDATGKIYKAGTNCAGNFFVMQDDFTPSFPVWSKVTFGMAGAGPVEQKMGSAIYREGSCGKCHSEPQSADSAGRVYLAPAGVNLPQQCQP